MLPTCSKSIPDLIRWLGEQDEFVFLDCARVSDEEHRTLLFTQPKEWLVCEDAGEARAFLASADARQQEGYYLAGWVDYEFGYLLEPSLVHLCPRSKAPFAVFGVFDAPLVIDHAACSTSVLKGLPFDGGTRPDAPYSVRDVRTNVAKKEYEQAITRIKEYIVAGDTYQVNYTMKLLFSFEGDPASFYSSLRRNQAVSYGAWIRRGGQDIMSFSPELFFRRENDRITVRPMKGTMRRGREINEDVRMRDYLRNDLKNRSENVMIVDLLRNDLGRLLYTADGGVVKPRSLFDVEVYESLLQMTSTIDGFPSGNTVLGLREIMSSLFPCGSVTGAPKIRTMEIIHELEKDPRGVYCGAIGYSGPDVSVFNVPIRTVVIHGNTGEMGIGSGIVNDSQPEAEWNESLLKGSFLTNSQPEFQLIETLLWRPGSGYWLLREHLDRLAGSAEYFLFGYSEAKVVELLAKEAAGFVGAKRVRLLLYQDGRVDITAAELDDAADPAVEPASRSGPLPKVVFSTIATDPENIHLYHKTTHRSVYVEERKKAVDAGCHEVLFVNQDGEVTEGSITNIFVHKDGRLLTPPVRCGLLAGTFRRHLLAQGFVEEKVLAMEDVRRAEAVYIGNSVRGLVQVAIEER